MTNNMSVEIRQLKDKGTDTKDQDATIKTLQDYITSLEARIAALENT